MHAASQSDIPRISRGGFGTRRSPIMPATTACAQLPDGADRIILKAPSRCFRRQNWRMDPWLVRVIVPVLSSPAALTAVDALSSALAMNSPPLLVSVPPTARLLPPSPPRVSTSSVPGLLRAMRPMASAPLGRCYRGHPADSRPDRFCDYL